MAKYSYGIASFLVGDITPVTGVIDTGVESKETIYKGTFNVTEEEGTTTDHYSEMDSTPKVSFTEVGKETLTWQCMDTDVDQLVRYLGGTKSTVEGRDVWSKPSGAVVVEKYLQIITSDGTQLDYPRVKITARKNFQLRSNGIWLLDVTATVLTPLLPVGSPLAPVIVKDPV